MSEAARKACGHWNDVGRACSGAARDCGLLL